MKLEKCGAVEGSALEAKPHYHISRESPCERSEHGPVICKTTEETGIEHLIRPN